jgi:hypothetical protein
VDCCRFALSLELKKTRAVVVLFGIVELRRSRDRDAEGEEARRRNIKVGAQDPSHIYTHSCTITCA